MLNVIKMEAYRMIKSKCFLVMLIIWSLCTIVTLFGAEITFSNNLQDNSKEKIESQEERTLGNIVNSELIDGDLLILIGIAATIFTTSETKSGFIKNSAISTKKRWHLSFAKSISVGILTLSLLLVNIIINVVFGKLIITDFKLNFSLNFFGMIFNAFLLMMAFSSLIIAISVLSKRNSIGVVSACFLATGAIPGIILFIEKQLGIVKYDISKYFIVSNVSKLSLSNSSGEIIRFIIVSIIAFFIYNLISGFILSKRDIK